MLLDFCYIFDIEPHYQVNRRHPVCVLEIAFGSHEVEHLYPQASMSVGNTTWVNFT